VGMVKKIECKKESLGLKGKVRKKWGCKEKFEMVLEKNLDFIVVVWS
jgi:hypothetical protein